MIFPRATVSDRASRRVERGNVWTVVRIETPSEMFLKVEEVIVTDRTLFQGSRLSLE